MAIAAARLATAAFALLLASCGGGGGGSPPGQGPPPPAPPLDVTTTGTAVVKVRPSPDGVTMLEETLTSLTQAGPERRITLLDPAGRVRGRYSAPAGFSVVDFAQHASGEVSVAIASAKAVTLVRLDRLASVRDDFPLVDAQAPQDPFYDSGGVRDDQSMVPVFTHDAVRVAPIGEDLAVALRTGRNAVVAYRFDHASPGGYARAWRTLVEPGVSMFGVGITSGTFDTFGQLENHFHVQVDADAAGEVAVAVVGKGELGGIFAAHADFFHQPTSITSGLLVTRLGIHGERLGTTLIDTVRTSELHGLRMGADRVALVGRVFSEVRADGSGWDAYAASVDRASGALAYYRLLDIDRGEVLFDAVPLAGGRVVAGGSAGYTQNPTGASVSEQSAPLLVVLEADGTARQRIALADGPRQDQVRSIVERDGAFLVAGLVNGPGTHSGDANPALIAADGFARDIQVAIP